MAIIDKMNYDYTLAMACFRCYYLGERLYVGLETCDTCRFKKINRRMAYLLNERCESFDNKDLIKPRNSKTKCCCAILSILIAPVLINPLDKKWALKITLNVNVKYPRLEYFTFLEDKWLVSLDLYRKGLRVYQDIYISIYHHIYIYGFTFLLYNLTQNLRIVARQVA